MWLTNTCRAVLLAAMLSERPPLRPILQRRPRLRPPMESAAPTIDTRSELDNKGIDPYWIYGSYPYPACLKFVAQVQRWCSQT